MKKYFCLLMVVSVWVGNALAQPLPDSVMQRYKSATNIKDKRSVLTRYINSIRTADAFFPQTKALIDYLRAAKEDDIADYVQLPINDQRAKTGDYITALASSLELSNKFEKRNDKQGMLMTYRTLSITYYYAGDPGNDVAYANKAAAMAMEMNSFGSLTSIYNNLSTSYAQRKMADSAIFFAKKAVAAVKKSKDTNQLAAVLGTLGEAYILQEKYGEALVYIRQSLTTVNNYDALGEAWNLNDMAQIFIETGQLDSAKFYAYRAANLSATNRFKDQLQRAYEYLSRAYAATNATDSAFRYLQAAVVIKDSLYSSEKSKQVSGITGREEARLQAIETAKAEMETRIRLYSLVAGLIVLCVIAGIFYRNNRQKQQANKVLETTLSNLKATQAQLIQSEKMASLGELTAGIAHEIQNPLNFVNNFSEINQELIEEIKSQKATMKPDALEELLDDIAANEEKINYHGKRADAIVKGMLQHTQASSGQKEPTAINDLADEYLKLSYHGLRAKDKNFNATILTDFDDNAGNINIIPQDIGRVLLNLFNNAFYAVSHKLKSGQALPLEAGQKYEPKVSVSTKRIADQLVIKVTDNGNGIPPNIVDKIFQPFFTTKPTGQGTGLGLSLSYDIIKAHSGNILVSSSNGAGTTFTINLPHN